MAFGVPFVLLLLFGYALTMDIDDIPMAVVDYDHSAQSRDLVGSFVRTGFFSVVEPLDDPEAILHTFRVNRAKVALIIPRGFAHDLARGERAQAQLIADGTDANVAAIAMGYAAAIGQQKSLELRQTALDRQGLAAAGNLQAPVRVESRNWFNPHLTSQWYLVPGLIAVIMAMMSAILMALTVAREWERGTMEQLLVTPVRPVEILLGKLIPYFIIGVGQLTLVIGAGVTLFDVPITGNLALLYLISSLFLVGALGQGLLISVITRQQQVAIQISLISSMLPALLLSGFMSPIASMPPVIQYLTYIIPARYFLVVTRGIFLKGLSLTHLWPQALALSLFATLMVVLAAKRFKTRLD
jgi:ABC-2 type transport system permease protein